MLAITQAICEYRGAGTSTGRCSSASIRTRCPSRRSRARWRSWPPTASSVSPRTEGTRRRPPFARDPDVQPRPRAGLADGIVITPSHNPPEDGGFKYNPPNGGPADTDVTSWIESAGERTAGDRPRGREAHALRAGASRGDHAPARFPRAPMSTISARGRSWTRSRSGLRIGVDPLGGAAVHYWPRIAEGTAST